MNLLRIHLFSLATIVALLVCNVPATAFETKTIESDSKPNILFIIADDMCFNMIGAHGHPEVRTPHLDRLARAGTSFGNAYNMGGWNGAICIASRTMLNTGRFIWRAKSVKPDAFIQQNKTWSQMLSGGGYETYMTGKWHVQRMKADRIFDHVTHIRPGMPNQTPAGYERPTADKSDPWSPYDPKFEGFWKGGKHWSEVLADDAETFLNQAKNSDKPFFMYLAFNAPHDPRQAPKEFVDMYPTEEVLIPANFLPEYPFKQQMGCYKFGKNSEKSKPLRDENLAPFPRTQYAVQVHRQEYYAITTHMDEQIGRILDALESTGKKDNTYIFFTDDHGLACGQHGLLGKQNMYEHSMKAPLMVVGPDVPAGERRNQFAYIQDVVPTSLKIAGVEQPNHVEFKSLFPRIADKNSAQAYEEIYGAYQASFQRMIRVGDWKLIAYPDGAHLRLFNVENDPYEKNDLADQPESANRVKNMLKRMIALCESMDDKIDLKSTYAEWLGDQTE